MDIRLIVRGDDFGITHSCNLAIESCFNSGILTSAAIIAPSPWAQEAAAMAKSRPEWCVGAHLTTLGEWRGYRLRPVLPYDKVSTLVDENGFLYQAPADLFAAPIDFDQLEREFMAQADLIANRWGVNLGYVDYHYVNGRSQGLPEYEQVLKRVAKAYGVPLSGYEDERRMQSIYKTDADKKVAVFIDGLEKLDAGVWYTVHHLLQDDPEARALKYGDPKDETPGGTALHRSAEAATLKDPSVRRRIDELGIKLISYRDIKSVL